MPIKPVAMAQKIGDTIAMVDGLINLSVSYNHLEKFEKAFQVLKQALPLAKKNGDLYQLVTICNNMADYYLEKKDFNAALAKCLEMHNNAKQISNQYFLSSSNFMLAKVYYELKQYSKALTHIAAAEQLDSEVAERAELKTIYKIRGDIDEARGNYKSSTAYFLKNPHH